MSRFIHDRFTDCDSHRALRLLFSVLGFLLGILCLRNQSNAITIGRTRAEQRHRMAAHLVQIRVLVLAPHLEELLVVNDAAGKGLVPARETAAATRCRPGPPRR